MITLFVEEKRHCFEPDGLLTSPWISSRPTNTAELVRLSSKNRSFDAHIDKSTVILDAESRRGGTVVTTSRTTRLHPRDAIAFLSMPLNIVVENEANDGAFLLWMARALGLASFIDAYRAGWISFRHAGGKGLIPSAARIMSHGVWARRDEKYSRALKCWTLAVLDSDSSYPGDNPNASLVLEAAEYCLSVHQLRSRSIESYIPIDVIRSSLSSAADLDRVKALDRLTEVQKRHYHMKSGFKIGSESPASKANFLASPHHPAQQRALYSSLPDADWTKLANGFGKGLSSVYTDEARRPDPSKKVVSNPEHAAEIRTLLNHIYGCF
ncbi:hypothetical protein [Arenimonas sp. MALMAid1274]|uniref:hypothetical protein n=1 Tax=Arenimonas sp. MALMAid1274 TaxID=3411630 RepID=UPI003B9F8D58